MKYINTIFINITILLSLGGCSFYDSQSPQLKIKQHLDMDSEARKIKEAKRKEEIKKELLKLQKKEVQKYTIGSGDYMHFYLYGEPDLTITNGLVKPDGTYTVPMIGDIKISGLTINDAMAKISEGLKKFMIEPIVTLVPSEFKSQNYTILGKVVKSGIYPVNEGTRVLDSLADAGGLSTGIFKNNTIELADLEHAYIRRDGKVLPVDFVELVRKGNPLHNIPLKDKDYIYIPSSLNTEVYILGETKAPGYFGYSENMTLSQLISYAQGFTSTANLREIAIIRGHLEDPEVFVVNYKNIIEGKNMDFILKPYDMVFIPKTSLGDWNTIMTMILPNIQTITSGYLLNQMLTE